MAADLPWRPTKAGVEVRVHLTPRAARDEVSGVGEGAQGPEVKVRVRALPADGEANAALAKLMARWVGVPPSRVNVVAGGRSRIKSVEIAGASAEIAQRLAAALGSTG